MRNAIMCALVVAATPAAAQPVTSPATCTVTISRAPEDVRAVVEAWVQAEPRCASSVEVRIVPTDGGLYLLAEDEHGRVRERIVPDAQSAGVLIASWVADDTFPPEKTVVFVPGPVPPAAPLRSSAAVLGSEGLLAPGQAEAHPVAPKKVPKWLSLGLLLEGGDRDGGGLRAELDIKSWGEWSLGLAASISGMAYEWDDEMTQTFGWNYFVANDKKLVANLVRTFRSGRWHLRAGVGAGAVYTHASGSMMKQGAVYPNELWSLSESKLSPTAEGSLAAGCQLGHWALLAGPVFSLYSQEFAFTYSDAWGENPRSEPFYRRDVEMFVYAGLRHRL